MRLFSTTFWLVWSLVGASHYASAQADFRPGYVLTLSGDTLKGEVDQRDARLSAQRCRFRPGAGAAVTTYTPTQARAYGLANADTHYRAQAVPAGDSLLAAGGRYFMEVIVDGSAQLYYLRSEQNQERYYIASPALPLALLKHEVRTVVRDGRRYEEEQAAFRQTLAQALVGCAPAQVKLPTLVYAENALRRVVQLYNSCQGAKPDKPASSTAAIAVGVGVAGGVHRSQFSFGELVRTRAPSLTPYTGFTGGLTLGLLAPRVSRKLSLEIGAFYERQRYDIEYVEPYAGGIVYQQRSQVQLDLSYLQLPLLLRYTYPRGALRPLAEAGMVFRRSFVRTNTYSTTDYQGVKSSYEPLVRDEDLEGQETSLGGGLGLTTSAIGGRAICLLVRAEKSITVTKSSLFSATAFSMRALLSINLTK